MKRSALQDTPCERHPLLLTCPLLFFFLARGWMCDRNNERFNLVATRMHRATDGPKHFFVETEFSSLFYFFIPPPSTSPLTSRSLLFFSLPRRNNWLEGAGGRGAGTGCSRRARVRVAEEENRGCSGAVGRDWRGTESARGGWMREMKWQINVNRRRPFITGLRCRGRVYDGGRVSEWASGDVRCMYVHTYERRLICVRARARRFIELEKRYRKNSKLYWWIPSRDL